MGRPRNEWQSSATARLCRRQNAPSRSQAVVLWTRTDWITYHASNTDNQWEFSIYPLQLGLVIRPRNTQSTATERHVDGQQQQWDGYNGSLIGGNESTAGYMFILAPLRTPGNEDGHVERRSAVYGFVFLGTFQTNCCGHIYMQIFSFGSFENCTHCAPRYVSQLSSLLCEPQLPQRVSAIYFMSCPGSMQSMCMI